MIQTENELLPKARETLERILRSVPAVVGLDWDHDQNSDQKDMAQHADLTVGVTTAHRLDTLVVELKSPGHPRQLREAVTTSCVTTATHTATTIRLWQRLILPKTEPPFVRKKT